MSLLAFGLRVILRGVNPLGRVHPFAQRRAVPPLAAVGCSFVRRVARTVVSLSLLLGRLAGVAEQIGETSHGFSTPQEALYGC
jgi:hypothetical protein